MRRTLLSHVQCTANSSRYASRSMTWCWRLSWRGRYRGSLSWIIPASVDSLSLSWLGPRYRGLASLSWMCPTSSHDPAGEPTDSQDEIIASQWCRVGRCYFRAASHFLHLVRVLCSRTTPLRCCRCLGASLTRLRRKDSRLPQGGCESVTHPQLLSPSSPATPVRLRLHSALARLLSCSASESPPLSSSHLSSQSTAALRLCPLCLARLCPLAHRRADSFS